METVNVAGERLKRAISIAEETLKDETRGNGHPFIEHPQAVARIVSEEIGLGEDSLCSVYLHEASRKHRELMPLIMEEFGKEIYGMVEGLNKISEINPKDTRLEADRYKGLIVSYSKDPRVTVIKIADRLEVMRSLSLIPKAARERKALETLMLYIPLAHQLGLYNIKSEMEDIYFSYADPEQYRTITNKLRATEKDREILTERFIGPLRHSLEEKGVKYKLKIRTKTAYSIWKKIQKQGVPFEKVYDVFAIRFIVDCNGGREEELALCWDVFSMVTGTYRYDPARVRDWLSNPKPNGYESLHVTVQNESGAYLEVQIRSNRMDETAESGLASHWSYKGIKREATLDSWLTSVRSKLESGEGLEDFVENDDGTAFSRDVFVFTPSGELRKLPPDATVLDFAFEIHSNVGMQCAGGLVNGRSVPIREKLKTGDYVEIIRNKNQKPSADWLNYVVTSKARSRIRICLKEEEFRRASEGKELLTSKFRKWKIDIQDDEIAALMKKYRIKELNQFYEEIADGRIDILDIRKFIETRRDVHSVSLQTVPGDNTAATGAADSGQNPAREEVLILDAKHVKGLGYKLSRCCNPVYGDEIFGFITRLDGIKIHRISCPNAARLLDQYPYRILKVKWGK